LEERELIQTAVWGKRGANRNRCVGGEMGEGANTNSWMGERREEKITKTAAWGERKN